MCLPSGRAITQDCPYKPETRNGWQRANPMTNMKSQAANWALSILILGLPGRVLSFCHDLEVVQGRIMRVAASAPAPVLIEWFGHATFQITSSKGTRILADPHSRDDLPWPNLPQHIVTTSHQHGAHANVWMAKGNPVILHGLTPGGENWQKISTTIRDVSVYLVPAYHDKSQGLQRGKNAIFVFRVDDICIAHLGDLGHELTPTQLKQLGKIDILLVPIAGGMFTVTPTEAITVTKQVAPRIAIPEHYWWEGAADGFVRGFQRVRQLNRPLLRITKSELPQPTEVVVMTWHQR
jgi:L-ascorbate metabolism protein UlaG (beta-lactamase superfamily)